MRAASSRILAVGTTIDTCRAALAVADAEERRLRDPRDPSARGREARADRLDELRELLGHPRAVAVGETGLDFYRDHAPRERQREVFEAELDLAAELGKPVVDPHPCRRRGNRPSLERFDGTVVLHCFSSPPLLRVALERGYYVSFAGNVTFPNASDLRLAASQVPAEPDPGRDG